MFQINYQKLVALLSPTFLRRDVIMAFLNALTAPVVSLYNLFEATRTKTLYQLRLNGQVCYLRKALNDAFVDANGQIRIEDVIRGTWTYAWDESFPEKQLIIPEDGGISLWDEDTILAQKHTFLVYVPASIENANNDAKLRSILNYYKLTSKSYKIIYE
jgi:hypothetical protein